MAELMTVERIRDAAHTLRVTYLPIMRGASGEDWREQVDVSELLADLLYKQAAAIEDLQRAGGPLEGIQARIQDLPENRALFALVERIEDIR